MKKETEYRLRYEYTTETAHVTVYAPVLTDAEREVRLRIVANAVRDVYKELLRNKEEPGCGQYSQST